MANFFSPVEDMSKKLRKILPQLQRLMPCSWKLLVEEHQSSACGQKGMHTHAHTHTHTYMNTHVHTHTFSLSLSTTLIQICMFESFHEWIFNSGEINLGALVGWMSVKGHPWNWSWNCWLMPYCKSKKDMFRLNGQPNKSTLMMKAWRLRQCTQRPWEVWYLSRQRTRRG